MRHMLSIAIAIVGIASPGCATDLVDEFQTGFEETVIPSMFEPCMRPENTIATTRERHRSGKQSLLLKINPTPLFTARLVPEIFLLKPLNCEVADKLELYRNDDYERAELWENRDYSPNFGDEAWYGFSMFVDKESAPSGDFNRVVLGQWKAQYNDSGIAYSPFLAQRLTGGFYHVTLDVDAKPKGKPEDKNNPMQCKVLLAFAEGAPSKLDEPLTLDRPAICETRLENSKYELEPIEPLKITRTAYLPNPFDKWTDVVVGMRGGANGFVELWVNSALIARATGQIGHRKALRDKQYFKFGPYRDTAGYPFIVYLDNLARGKTKEFVDPCTR